MIYPLSSQSNSSCSSISKPRRKSGWRFQAAFSQRRTASSSKRPNGRTRQRQTRIVARTDGFNPRHDRRARKTTDREGPLRMRSSSRSCWRSVRSTSAFLIPRHSNYQGSLCNVTPAEAHAVCARFYVIGFAEGLLPAGAGASLAAADSVCDGGPGCVGEPVVVNVSERISIEVAKRWSILFVSMRQFGP